MSNLPEFIQPITEPPKKPDPIAGLGEYLQSQLGDRFKTLTAINQTDEIFTQLQSNPNAILWLDLEIDPKTDELIDGAFVLDNLYWHFDKAAFTSHVNDIYQLLRKANFLGGHNLIEFDLPRIINLMSSRLAKSSHSDYLSHTLHQEVLPKLQAKTWDTLSLSCLLIPHQSTHALTKLYKANTHYNNPVMDCLESRLIFDLCQNAWQNLSSDSQVLYQQLLPAFANLAKGQYFPVDNDCMFDWDTIASDMPEGNSSALIALLKSGYETVKNHPKTLAHPWQYLGLACFVNWLRYFAKPQARRPVWISKHPVYKISFAQAEEAFWQLHEPDETWINQQFVNFFGKVSPDYKTLRDGQMAIVKATLANQDIPLGILPTGGGKSITFQLPALIFSKYQRQLTVVISPLKALIEDQVINLHTQLPDYESRIAYLTSGQTPETQKDIITGVWQGDIDILYLSPERLRTHSIRQLLKNRPPAFWVLMKPIP